MHNHMRAYLHRVRIRITAPSLAVISQSPAIYSQYTATDNPKEKSKIKNFFPIPPMHLLYVCIAQFFAETFHLPLVGSWPAWSKSPLTSDSAHPKKILNMFAIVELGQPKDP